MELNRLERFSKVSGLTASQFKESFEKDAAGGVISFLEGLAKMSAQGRNVFQILDELGFNGIRVTDSLLRASGAGDLFRRSLEIGNRAWKENTALLNEMVYPDRMAVALMKPWLDGTTVSLDKSNNVTRFQKGTKEQSVNHSTVKNITQ